MNRLQANLCLICVTLCWSTEVIIFACIPNDVLPFATSFITSAIAAIILVASFFKRIKAEMKRNAKRILLRCVFLGIIKCGYDVLFLYGLNYFDVSTGAFTFSITVVVLPVILLTMKKNVSPKTWLSALLVLAGIVCALGSQVFYHTFGADFLDRSSDQLLYLDVFAAADLWRDQMVADNYSQPFYLRIFYSCICTDTQYICTKTRYGFGSNCYLFAGNSFFTDLECSFARNADRQGNTDSVSGHRCSVDRSRKHNRNRRF